MANSAMNRSQITALAAIAKEIGDQYVITDEPMLDAFSQDFIPIPTRAGAVLRPASRNQIMFILKLANKVGLELYPISCGKNWGYGSACPVQDGQVVLDLSRMNRILFVDSQLAYAVVEPGVTQGDIYEYLEKHHPGLMADMTGAGPSASLLGNTLERGFGHTPYADHFQFSSCYEVILATGEIISTGFGAFASSITKYLYKPGIGPALDGVFSQSNFGIVVSMGIWLQVKPQHIAAFAIRMNSDEEFAEVIERLRPLRMNGVIQGAIHFANDLRIISGQKSSQLQSILSDDELHKLRKQTGIGAWNVLGAFTGSKDIVKASKKSLKKALHGSSRPIFIDQKLLSLMEGLIQRFPSFVPTKLKFAFNSVSSIFKLLNGIPTPEHLRGVFWRAGVPVQAEVDVAKLSKTVGLMWSSPMIPMERSAVLTFLSLVKKTYAAHQMDPLITMTMINARTLCCVLSINFDKASQQQCEHAQALYDELSETLFVAGAVPYRLGIQGMEKMNMADEDYLNVLHKIKLALDPNHILAPGRYLPQSKNLATRQDNPLAG